MFLDNFKQELNAKGEVYLRIKVRPAMGKSEFTEIITDENGETVKINIGAPPVKGKANQELVKFLAKEFAVSRENVKIISGSQSRVKLVKVLI